MKEKTLSKNKNIFIMIALISCLFLPAFIQCLTNLGTYKQLIIGSLVNCALFISSVYVKDNKKIVAMSVLPSVSNILTGILFTGFTFYSKMMIPFIWLGNLSLVYLTRIIFKKIKYTLSGMISIIVKVSIIYGGFKLMSTVFNFPSKIINLMSVSFGITQIYTACIGLLLSLVILNVNKKLEK